MIKIRASSVGYIMTDPRSKSESLSETAKTHLIDMFVAERYERQTEIENRYVKKGLQVEEDSITLYSRLKKRFFKKNEVELQNEFVRGTPDLFEGLEILEADTIIDIKSSWDIYTFTRARFSPVNKHYWWQLQTYMALTGAKKACLAYCLVNTPEIIINDDKRRLLYKMGVATEDNTDYIKACEEVDRNMTFDDIPMGERMHEFLIERDEEAIQRIYDRVAKCREYYEQTFCNELIEV